MALRGSLLLVIALAVGAIASAAALLTLRADLSSRLASAEANLAAQRTQNHEVRLGWQSQLDSLTSVDSDRPVRLGVHLAKIVDVSSDSSRLTFDWLGTDGAATEGRVRNESTHRQTLFALPLLKVFTAGPASNFEDSAPIPVTDVGEFQRVLQTDSAEGRALRQANWWVSVYGGGYSQLVQASE